MRDLYTKLRKTTVGNVCGNWVTDEYFFELSNKEHEDGAGGGNRPFNGWTSVITLIINEKYIPSEGKFFKFIIHHFYKVFGILTSVKSLKKK